MKRGEWKVSEKKRFDAELQFGGETVWVAGIYEESEGGAPVRRVVVADEYPHTSTILGGEAPNGAIYMLSLMDGINHENLLALLQAIVDASFVKVEPPEVILKFKGEADGS